MDFILGITVQLAYFLLPGFIVAISASLILQSILLFKEKTKESILMFLIGLLLILIFIAGYWQSESSPSGVVDLISIEIFAFFPMLAGITILSTCLGFKKISFFLLGIVESTLFYISFTLNLITLTFTDFHLGVLAVVFTIFLTIIAFLILIFVAKAPSQIINKKTDSLWLRLLAGAIFSLIVPVFIFFYLW